MHHGWISSASQNLLDPMPAQQDVRDTQIPAVAIRLLRGCQDLGRGELGAPDLGFLELGPCTNGYMPIPLTMVPFVIRAVSHLTGHLP